MDKDDLVYAVDTCVACGYALRVTWTDYHGEGVCLTCGTPYQIIQYDTDDLPIRGALPLFALRSDMIPAMQEYWHTEERDMGLGTYLMYHPRVMDVEAFYDWLAESKWWHLTEEG